MNEQIQELLLKNKDSFANGVTETSGQVYIHGSQDNLQKFADLIVQECLTIVHERRVMAPTDDDGYFKVALDMASTDIKRYFGVEE